MVRPDFSVPDFLTVVIQSLIISQNTTLHSFFNYHILGYNIINCYIEGFTGGDGTVLLLLHP